MWLISFGSNNIQLQQSKGTKREEESNVKEKAMLISDVKFVEKAFHIQF